MESRIADKLDLIMKALAVSRGQLASQLAVDKSIVSRWVSGANSPSGENLTVLTRWVSARVPGFTGLHWEGDLAEVAALVGAGAPEPKTLSAAFDFWLRKPVLIDAVASTGAVAALCEGFWRTLRPVPNAADWYIREYVLIQGMPSGLMRFRAGSLNVRLDGWCYCVGNQLFSSAIHETQGQSMFGIYHRPVAGKAEVMDGMILWPQSDGGGLIQASASYLERVEDLVGAEEDEARFETLLAEAPIVPRDEVPAELQRYLTQRSDAQSVLGMPFIGSQSYLSAAPPKAASDDSTVVNLRLTARG
jgi:hypothetical protein